MAKTVTKKVAQKKAVKKAVKEAVKKITKKAAKKTPRAAAKKASPGKTPPPKSAPKEPQADSSAAGANAGANTGAGSAGAGAASGFGPTSLFDMFDPSKMMAQFNEALSGSAFDSTALDQVIGGQQKNLAALTEANRQIMAGAQAVVERQTVLLQQAATEALAGAGASGAVDGELAARAYARAAAHVEEVSQTIVAAQQQALTTLQQRWQESLAELQGLPKKKS